MKEFTRLECIAKTQKTIDSILKKQEAYESRPYFNGYKKIRLTELQIELAYYQKILSIIRPTSEKENSK